MKVMSVKSSHRAADDTVLRAADALRAGKLVGLPTETVFGIAASMTQASGMQSLKDALEIKGHPGWVIHIPSAASVAGFVSHVPSLARRLIRRLWPGPVSIQLPVDHADVERLASRLGRQTAAEAMVEGFLTFRCTEIELTRDILHSSGEPVTVVGVTTHQRVDVAEDLPKSLLQKLSVVVAGPAPRYKNPSTLVRIAGHHLEVVREGAIAERVIRRLEDMVIVFVCSGNTCRSPMAAGLATRILSETLHIPIAELPNAHVLVRSAGVHAARGMPAAPEAVKIAGEMGADIHQHRSVPLTDDLLRRADMIYTMTQAHRDEIISHAPLMAEKTFTLDPDGDIEDPIGKGEQVYRRTAQRIEKLIRNRVAELEL